MTTPVADASPESTGALEGADSGYSVKLPVFEGPLDLLLHLIRLNEVEITHVPIARICEQYLEYLGLMRELNLDVAGEYLLMAATLAWIKSRMLLPPDGELEQEEQDPRAQLIARLLEYQRFKEAAEALGGRSLLGRDVFAARGPEPEAVPDGEREIEVGLFQLIEALRRALREAPVAGRAHEVHAEPVTVRERMLTIMQLLEDRESLRFDEIFEGGLGAATRAMIVATFLAMLELTRLAALRLFQGASASGAPSGPIRLLRGESPGADWTERISDLM